MKQQILWALVAALALPAISNADIIDPNTAFSIRVGQTGNFAARVQDGSAHNFTSNFFSGGGTQTIGNIVDPILGAAVLVNASDTFTVDAQGNFTYTLTVESAARSTDGLSTTPGFGDLSVGPASGNGTGLFIGSNLTGAFNVDPDFGAANPFTPTNAVVLPHFANTAVLSVFDLDTGALRGSDSVIGVGAFNNAGQGFSAFEGNLGVAVSTGEDNIPAGTIPTGRIGAVTLTITGSIPEPSCVTVLGLMGMGLVTRRRR